MYNLSSTNYSIRNKSKIRVVVLVDESGLTDESSSADDSGLADGFGL